MGRKTAVRIGGEISIHVSADGLSGNYDTLCGLAGDDPGIGHENVAVPRGAKIDCGQCRAIWEGAKQFKTGDFA